MTVSSDMQGLLASDKTATDDNDLISKHGFFREVSTNQDIAVVDTRHRQNKRFGT